MKIGERFQVDGQLIEVKKAVKIGFDSCYECYLKDKDCMKMIDLKCCSTVREDATDIIFKAVEE